MKNRKYFYSFFFVNNIYFPIGIKFLKYLNLNNIILIISFILIEFSNILDELV